jgi:hypothetical protein
MTTPPASPAHQQAQDFVHEPSTTLEATPPRGTAALLHHHLTAHPLPPVATVIRALINGPPTHYQTSAPSHTPAAFGSAFPTGPTHLTAHHTPGAAPVALSFLSPAPPPPPPPAPDMMQPYQQFGPPAPQRSSPNNPYPPCPANARGVTFLLWLEWLINAIILAIVAPHSNRASNEEQEIQLMAQCFASGSEHRRCFEEAVAAERLVQPAPPEILVAAANQPAVPLPPVSAALQRSPRHDLYPGPAAAKWPHRGLAWFLASK